MAEGRQNHWTRHFLALLKSTPFVVPFSSSRTCGSCHKPVTIPILNVEDDEEEEEEEDEEDDDEEEGPLVTERK